MRQYGQPARGRSTCSCCSYRDGAERKPSRAREKRAWRRDQEFNP